MRLRLLLGLLLWVPEATSVRAQADEPQVVPTFECAGISWRTASGSNERPCEVSFRAKGTTAWQEGFPLWFDDRDHEWGGEYRGSIVNLTPGQRYQLRLRAGDETAEAEFETWSEEFPIGKVHTLPESSDGPIVIRDSGTANARLVYQPGSESGAVVDAAGIRDNCIRIENASYIILRGLTLTGARRHAVELVGDVHDIVIEDCDISGWGQVEPDGWGRNSDSAVFSRSPTAERIVIQRNQIHHPRSDANSWAELRPTARDPENRHPLGPQAVYLAHSRGNHVIRFNRVWSDDEHQFNDIFGAADNYSTVGFPNRDSDIYGNRLSHCWDDAIESEGANCNVRIWGNHIDNVYVNVAVATTSVGPVYIWRNVAGESRQGPGTDSDRVSRGAFLKTSDRMAGGRIFVFHNTLLQPEPTAGAANTLGCRIGMGHGGGMMNVVSRNNIFHTSARGGPFYDRTDDDRSDYDYDLYNGQLHIRRHEQHGVRGIPVYAARSANQTQPLATMTLPLPYVPAPESPAVDTGRRILNFNDGFAGAGPDIGAVERQP